MEIFKTNAKPLQLFSLLLSVLELEEGFCAGLDVPSSCCEFLPGFLCGEDSLSLCPRVLICS